MSSWSETMRGWGMLSNTDGERSWADDVDDEVQEPATRAKGRSWADLVEEDEEERRAPQEADTASLFEGTSAKVEVRLPTTTPPPEQVSDVLESADAMASWYVAPPIARPFVHDWDNRAYMTCADMDADDWDDGCRTAMMVRLGRYLEDLHDPRCHAAPGERPEKCGYSLGRLPFYLEEDIERAHVVNWQYYVRPTMAQLILLWEMSQYGKFQRRFCAPGPSRLAAIQNAEDLGGEPEAVADGPTLASEETSSAGLEEEAAVVDVAAPEQEGGEDEAAAEDGGNSPPSSTGSSGEGTGSGSGSAGSGAWSGETAADSRSDGSGHDKADDDDDDAEAAYDALLELFEPAVGCAAADKKAREAPAGAADPGHASASVAPAAEEAVAVDAEGPRRGWALELPAFALPAPSTGQLLCLGSIAAYAGFMAWKAWRR